MATVSLLLNFANASIAPEKLLTKSVILKAGPPYKTNYQGRLVSLSEKDHLPDESVVPLIFIHGLSGSAKSFDQIIPLFSHGSRYHLLHFSYDELHRSLKISANELASAIRRLHAQQIKVIAHGAGGLVAREALNVLIRNSKLHALPEIHVIAVDTPWYGWGGHDCTVPLNPKTPAVSDMRSCSDFFKRLYVMEWPRKFSMNLIFAENGGLSWDSQANPLKAIPQKIADYISYGKPITGTAEELNFWQALRSSSQYSYLEVDLNSLHTESALSAETVKKSLQTYFPRLPGNHETILVPHPSRDMDIVRYLAKAL